MAIDKLRCEVCIIYTSLLPHATDVPWIFAPAMEGSWVDLILLFYRPYELVNPECGTKKESGEGRRYELEVYKTTPYP